MQQRSWNPNKVAVGVPDRGEKASDARISSVFIGLVTPATPLTRKRKGSGIASRASLYSAIEGRSRKCGGGVGPIAS